MPRGKRRRKTSSKKKPQYDGGTTEEENIIDNSVQDNGQVNEREKYTSVENESCDVKELNEEGKSSNVKRTYPKFFKYKDEELDMLCEWDECTFRSDSIDTFVKHVEDHIPELKVKIIYDEGVYVCLWSACDFESADSKEIIRHVNYHAFHTKIKCIGNNICIRTGVPPCNYHELGRNIVPEIPNSYKCNWEDCTCVFQNAQKFYFHAEAHVRGFPVGNNIKGGLPCCWGSCKGKFPSLHKVRDHLRSHTQEKLVGCPVCGGVYATRAKYYDHCKRQVPLEMHGYQCSHCFKFYPSERLLKGHMRLHVNHYKCPFCDMTCPGPASLSNHIRFRHLDDKPFKCELCDFRSKTQSDLACHHRVHLPDGFYKCNEVGCDYSARSPSALSWHYRRVHANEVDPMYCCHICNFRYSRGFLLTKHLVSKHSFQWPSGHCRFRYKLHEDGLYRLETVRYESLEVTQKMMAEREAAMLDSNKNRKGRPGTWMHNSTQYVTENGFGEEVDDPEFHFSEGSSFRSKKRRIKPDSPIKLKPPKRMTVVDQNDSDSSESSADEGNVIEIAVEELDERGQVVKLEFIRTKEVHVATEKNVEL